MRLIRPRAAHRVIGLHNSLRQRQQHSERVLGNGFAIAAGLVHHQDAGIRAGLDVDRVVTGAIRGDEQHIGHARDQRGIDVKLAREFMLGRPRLVDVGSGKDRRRGRVIARILKVVEADVGSLSENVDENRMGEGPHVEHALGINGHGL